MVHGRLLLNSELAGSDKTFAYKDRFTCYCLIVYPDLCHSSCFFTMNYEPSTMNSRNG